MKKITFIVALLSIVAFDSANAQAGSIDSSFGTNGIRSYEGALRVYTAPNGKIYVAYRVFYNDYQCNGIDIACYLPDGSLDEMYGNNGYSDTLPLRIVGALALQLDGKLIVSGGDDHCGDVKDDQYTGRLTQSGKLDPLFNGVGYILFSNEEFTTETVQYVVIGSDKIVVVGNSFHNGLTIYHAIGYDLSGAPIFYNRLYTVRVQDIESDHYNYNAAIQGDKIIISISAYDHTDNDDYNEIVNNKLTRYNANGSVDASFHPEAYLNLLGNSYTGVLVVKPDGKIVIASKFHHLLYGLNSDGSVDDSFGDHGVQAINSNPEVIISQGDKIITGSGISYKFVSRFNSNGLPDTGFGSGGTTVTNFNDDFNNFSLVINGNTLFINGNNFAAAYKLEGTTNLTCPHDTTFYVSDTTNCSAMAHGIDPVGTTDVTYTIFNGSVGGFTDTSGSGSVSGKLFKMGLNKVTYSTLGSPSCSFIVIVKDSSAPKVTAPLPDLTACPGSTVTFTPATKGRVLFYTLYKNDKPKQTYQEGDTLQLINVTKADEGKYKVIIYGHCSTDTSNIFTLKVNTTLQVSIPNSYTIDYYYSRCRKNTVYRGYINYATYATLLSEVSGGKPPYTYHWSDGSNISYTLVNPAATTTYTLTVTDSTGCSVTAKRQIKVLDVQCGAKSGQVLVCHKNSTLCLDVAAVAEHLRHGDCLGTCAESSNEQSIVNDESKSALKNSNTDQVMLQASPNPSNSYFTIQLKSNNQPGKVFIKVTDLAGRIVEVREDNAGKTIQLGSTYARGIYLLQSLQNGRVTTLKLIKE